MDDARRLLIPRARQRDVVVMDREGPRVRSHPRTSRSLATRHDVGSQAGHPCLWVIRCIGHTRRLPSTRVPHQFPQPSPLRNRVSATISFTSPKLSRNSSLPGPLPRPPYVATTPLEQLPEVIQASNRLCSTVGFERALIRGAASKLVLFRSPKPLRVPLLWVSRCARFLTRGRVNCQGWPGPESRTAAGGRRPDHR